MTFDALFTLVLVLIFVIGPLVRRLQGGPRPGESGPKQGERGRTPSPTASSDESDAPVQLDQELTRRLEEARRRVRQAMSEAPSGREARTPRGAGETAPGQLDWQEVYRPGEGRQKLDWQEVSRPGSTGSSAAPAPSRPTAGAGGTGLPTSGRRSDPALDWQQVVRPAESFIPSATASAGSARVVPAGAAAKAVSTERRPAGAGTAKLAAERLPALDRAGILQGIVWHEILGEPMAKRGIRRTQSRPRSR